MRSGFRLWGCAAALLFLLMPGCVSFRGRDEPVLTGLDVLERDGFKPFHGRKIAVVTNHTAVNSAGVHLLDLLEKCPQVELTAVFGPEHGVRGDVEAGGEIGDALDKTVPVYSLYGACKKPDSELSDLFDLMVYDVQDVGARFYTYIWTMFHVMEFCAETGTPLYVLDRPNPLGGEVVEGPVLDEQFASFVGMKPIPVRYGLTAGELAVLFNNQGWLADGRKVDLHVVKMKGWQRDMFFPETGLRWIPPSPNMPTWKTALVYPGMCMVEGSNWSEGRGTSTPFEIVGAPGIDADGLAANLNELGLAGCTFTPVSFAPHSIPGVASQPKYEGRVCTGVFLKVDDPETFRPIETGLAVISTLRKHYPNVHRWHDTHFDRLLGTDTVRKQIEAGDGPAEILDSWAAPLRKFDEIRKRAMLY